MRSLTVLRESLAPLRGRPFRYQFGAQATSMVGNALSPVALSLGVLDTGLSVVDLGLVLAAYTVPLVVFVLVGGVLADRLPRHRVMLVADTVRGAAQVGVGVLLLTGHPLVWALVALQAVTGTATAFYHPASTGLTATTVEPAHLQQANALLALTRSLSGSVGPLIASVLTVTAGAGWALVVDGLTFFGSALLLSRLRLPPRERTGPPQVFVRDLAEGFHEVRRRAWVWSSIGAFAVSNLATAALLVLGPALLLEQANGELGWGAVVAAMSAGQVAGNLLALRWHPGRPMLAARIVELTQVPILVAVALNAPVPVTIAAALVSGIGVTFPDAVWYSTLQRHLPERTISRVASYDWMGSLALRPIGFTAAAAVSAEFGLTGTLLAGAVLVLATRVLGALVPDVRRLRDTPEPAPATGTGPSTEPADVNGGKS